MHASRFDCTRRCCLTASGSSVPNHPATLATRANIAYLTGEVGDAGEALRLYRALLPGYGRVLGPDHPHTLIARGHIARLTGGAG